MGRTSLITLLLLLDTVISLAQVRIGDHLEMDKTVHNFGDVLLSDGPVSCEFTLTNGSSKAVEIVSITTSCGCTDVSWTKGEIAPGAKAVIKSTYTNADGPFPFDKTLTMYVSGVKNPVVLRLTGVAHEKQPTPEEAYPVVSGGVWGFKSDSFKIGNLEQGAYKSTTIKVYNFSSQTAHLEFSNLSDFLTVKIPHPDVPAGSATEVIFTVQASRELWGKNWYKATAPGGLQLSFWAITKESFPAMTREEKAEAPKIFFADSNSSVGQLKRGAKGSCSFEFTNPGKQTLKIYAADCDTPGVSVSFDKETPAGGKSNVSVTLDTALVPESEDFPYQISLYTNAPLRPIVILFVTGAYN